MVAHITSVAPIGFESALIDVESDTKQGLPAIQIVGMGNKSIDEAKERVRSAITNSLLEFPTRKITINLAPAELPKDGTHFDLPIALSILVASGQLKQHEVDHSIFAGELALDGTLRPIRGALHVAEAAKQAGISSVYLPVASTEQAALVPEITIYGITSLKELFLHLKREAHITPTRLKVKSEHPHSHEVPLLDDILGQDTAKRAITIATAGRHNILLSGPPGTGKTMLARALTGLLPPLSAEEQIAVTKLHSIAGETGDIIIQRPFRSPHHTASRIAMTGGGSRPKPGEISLAHMGVLFLDELPEYPRTILEALRQPLEDRHISLSRAQGRTVYPADFMLVATMNPCPCGYYGDTSKECVCTPTQIHLYQKKLSGPLLDRIDMSINVTRIDNDALLTISKMSNTQQKDALKSIEIARMQQVNRYKSSYKYNSSIASRDITRQFALSPEVRTLLATATDRLQLSARSYFKIIKVARTIADLEASVEISPQHVSEALQYRFSSADPTTV